MDCHLTAAKPLSEPMLEGISLIAPLGTNFSEILIIIYTFSFKKNNLKMSSGKWRPSLSRPPSVNRANRALSYVSFYIFNPWINQPPDARVCQIIIQRAFNLCNRYSSLVHGNLKHKIDNMAVVSWSMYISEIWSFLSYLGVYNGQLSEKLIYWESIITLSVTSMVHHKHTFIAGTTHILTMICSEANTV